MDHGIKDTHLSKDQQQEFCEGQNKIRCQNAGDHALGLVRIRADVDTWLVRVGNAGTIDAQGWQERNRKFQNQQRSKPLREGTPEKQSMREGLYIIEDRHARRSEPGNGFKESVYRIGKELRIKIRYGADDRHDQPNYNHEQEAVTYAQFDPVAFEKNPQTETDDHADPESMHESNCEMVFVVNDAHQN